MPQSDRKKPWWKTWWGTLLRVVGALVLWLVLSLAAAWIVAIVPSVQLCSQVGLSGCMDTVARSVDVNKYVAQTKWSDWLILVVSLVVAVRIIFPAPDPLEDDTRQHSSAR